MWTWLIVALAIGGCADEVPSPEHVIQSRIPEAEVATAQDPFEPVPQQLDLDPKRVELGRRLFAEPLLSRSGDRACIDCHDLEDGGIVPGEARSNHPVNPTGPYNVPTVFNIAFNFRYSWQGNFTTLEEHLTGGFMMAESVMNAGSWPELIERIRPTYQQDFVDAGYPQGATELGVREAIATYERSLITPNSRFDQHLRGEIALAGDEREGYELFKSVGCVSCHQGINVGGNLFQRYGVMEEPYGGRELGPRDYGRMSVTGRDEDAYVFRVPSLRNVELTPPYFHDGSAPTLEDAVGHMGRVQLGYTLTDDEVRKIAAFLRTLTGELSEGA